MVYPYYQDDKLFQQYTGLLNRLTGLADEMSSFFGEVKRLEVGFLKHNRNKEDIAVDKSKKKIDVCPKKPVSENGNSIVTETPEDCIKCILQE